MSRTVTGTLLLPNGQPMANARIFFTAKRTEAVSIVEGVNAFFDTDNDGDYSQVIVDGWYSVSIEWQADAAGSTVRRWQLGSAVVEAGASTTLEALIIASNPAASVETTLLYEVLEQAQQARDEAEAAADAAAASAATISPAKQAQWDQAYSERNRWDGSSSGLNAVTGRASLGLGTAAQAAVVMSPTDLTAGSVLTPGYAGLFGGAIKYGNLNNIERNQFMGATSASNTNRPTNVGWWVGLNLTNNTNAAESGQIVIGTSSDSGLHYRARYNVNADNYFPWHRAWDDGNLIKTASDTDTGVGRMLQVGNAGLLSTAPPVVNWTSSVGGTIFAQGSDGGPAGSTNVRGFRVIASGSDVHAFASRLRRYYGLTAGPNNGNNTVWDEFYSTGNTSPNVQTMLSAANNAAIRSAISASSLPPYALSTVPSAPANTNLLIVITDLSGGREPCFSDGVNWLRCSDKTIAN